MNLNPESARQIIISDGSQHRVSLWWENLESIMYPESNLILNFEPFYSTFNLNNTDALIHFQAKPKPVRRFGIYQGGSYYSTGAIAIEKPSETLRINDDNTPSNIILVKCAKLLINPTKIIIK